MIIYFYRRKHLKAFLFKSKNESSLLVPFCHHAVKMSQSNTWFSYRSLFKLSMLGLSPILCHPVQQALHFQAQGPGKQLSTEQDWSPVFLNQFPSCFTPDMWPTQTDIQLLVKQKVKKHFRMKVFQIEAEILGREKLWSLYSICIYIFIYLVHVYILKTFDFKSKPLIWLLFVRELRGFL